MAEKPPRNRKEQWIAGSLAAVLICVAAVGIIFSERINEQYIVYLFTAFSILLLSTLVLFLAWEQQRVRAERDEHDRLRVSEEEYRIAAQQSGKTIYRYDIATKSARYATLDRVLGYSPITENLPDSVIEAGLVSPDSEASYRAFFAEMAAGKPYGSGTFHLVDPEGKLLWNHADYTLITSETGKPLYAIVSYYDVTEQREKEIAYERWRQSVEQLPKDKVALYEYNLTRDSLHRTDGALLDFIASDETLPFTERVARFTGGGVHPDEADACRRFLNRGRLLAAYHQGARTDEMEFRLIKDGSEPRWLRLSLQMVEYPDDADIKAYFMFEDVDEEKRRALALKARSEEDSLTKALNREAFLEKTAQVIKSGGHDAQHAFLLIDIDNYKLVNDVLGHVAGDRTLYEISAGIRAKLRQGDLFGRLGGDEFMICLVNIPYDAVIEKRAGELCRLIQRVVDGEVKISASIGVSVYPRDGESFDELYQNADAALYRRKDGGGNGFTFFVPGMESGEGIASGAVHPALEVAPRPISSRKRAILIASDSDGERERLSDLFAGDFRIVEATGGAKALSAIQHYGTGLSVVLLERRMQDMDAAEILTRLRVNKGLASIPVIVTNAQETPEDTLLLVEQGAADCLPQNVDADILKLRVETAVGKSENDRLRIQNSYLLLQSEEEERYRNVIRSTGTVVLEYDLANNVYKYDPLTSQYLWGVYDNRALWHILLSDGVASASDITRMQRLTFRVANDAAATQDGLTVLLKTAKGDMRYFRMRILKMGDELDLGNRLLMTLNDVHEEILAEQKLRQLVEHDPTTGLLNRTAFMEKTQALIRESPPDTYVMGYFDINKFKAINDRFGHAAGDEFLRYIAASMTECFRDDGLCCRISADFFAVCTRHDESKLSLITEEFPRRMGQYGTDFEITACFGIYVIDDPELPVDSILDRAALAQTSIKGSYFQRFAYYDESLRRNLLEEQEIEGEMNAAIELLRANDKYRDMLRVTAEELEQIRFSPLSTMPEEDRNIYLTTMEWAIARNSENECVTRRLLLDRGEEDTLWIRSRLRPLARSNRRCILYVAAEDITAERRAQIRLSESQQALLTATKHTRLYYWVYDIANDRAVQGKSSQDELSIPEVMEDYPESLLRIGFIHPDFTDAYRELHVALKNGAREVSTSLRSAWKDGYEWRTVRYTVVEDRDGKPAKAIGTSESLAAYKELERRFTVAAQQSGIITWIYDRVRRCAYQDVAAEGAERLLPAAMQVPEEAMKNGVVHPDDADAFRALYERIDRGEHSAACLVRLKSVTGGDHWRWYRLSYTLNTGKDGDTNLAVGAAVDVSDQIIMQKRFQDAIARYENENWEGYANHARVNLTRGVVETSRGISTYETLIEEMRARVPDAVQRDGLLQIVDRERLLSEFLQGVSRYAYECRIIFDDGLSRWVSTQVRLHLDPTTQDLFAFFRTRDIHNEKMRAFTYERVIREDYDFVTGIDTRTHRYTMICREADDRFRPAPEGDDFETAMRAYSENTVFEEDRAAYCRELTLSHMVERLESEGSYHFDVRCYDENSALHSKRIAVHYIDRETGMTCLTRTDLDRLRT